MQRFFVEILVATLLVAASQSASATITIDTVPVGNAGNANDPATGNLYGGVPYNYSMGKYDVTIGQYTAFLNAVADDDTYGLYNTNMRSAHIIAGINRDGSPGAYSYAAVTGTENKPIAFITWGAAARFANWMSNGQPVGSEGPGTTETGSYTLNGATSAEDLANVVRNPTATWVIPTENEWYKAAYYDPTLNASSGGYYAYPYSSDSVPISTVPGNIPNTGNFYDKTTGYALTGSTTLDFLTQNYLTDVGAYTSSASPYGAFDMGGNVYQWNEALISGAYRLLRGGAWEFYSSSLGSSSRSDYQVPTFLQPNIGFRLALVPEPSSLALAAIGGVTLVALARSRLKSADRPTPACVRAASSLRSNGSPVPSACTRAGDAARR